MARAVHAHKAHHRTNRTAELIVQEHSKECFFLWGGDSEGGQGAGISGVYWGLLGALTAFAYWGAREAEGCGNSHPCQGATISVVYWGRSLRSLIGGGAKAPYWGAREAEGGGDSHPCHGATIIGLDRIR